jgi:hypothetical protein
MFSFGMFQKDFIGVGAVIDCPHCTNRSYEHVYVTYSYEQVIVKVKRLGARGSMGGDGRIVFMCSICTYGFHVDGQELTDYSKKSMKGEAAAKYGIESELARQQAQARFDIKQTSAWRAKLNPIDKALHFRMLRRLGLFALIANLE